MDNGVLMDRIKLEIVRCPFMSLQLYRVSTGFFDTLQCLKARASVVGVHNGPWRLSICHQRAVHKRKIS